MGLAAMKSMIREMVIENQVVNSCVIKSRRVKGINGRIVFPVIGDSKQHASSSNQFPGNRAYVLDCIWAEMWIAKCFGQLLAKRFQDSWL